MTHYHIRSEMLQDRKTAEKIMQTLPEGLQYFVVEHDDDNNEMD